MEIIRTEIEKSPDKYTVWFRIAFEEVEKYIQTTQ
jgi:hypothetical protein